MALKKKPVTAKASIATIQESILKYGRKSLKDTHGDVYSRRLSYCLKSTNLLDHLIEESVALVGKPVPLMNKEDKVTAIQFLNDAGAFLITKSGDKVANYFGISKYTLYSYIDVNK